jgi:CBS domain containing-hemolysin-like protein
MVTLVKIFLVLFLVLANGFFVAAEFALVSVRRSRIEVLAAAGRRGAKSTLRAVDHLDAIISATQFGITLASLALGWIGEATLAHLFDSMLVKVLPPGQALAASHTIAIVIAFALITYLHIVLGELAPKTLALQRAEAVSLAVARPMELFYAAFKPFIAALNSSGAFILRLFGLDAQGSHHATYTGEELRQLITQSHQSGNLQLEAKNLIHNIFEFSDLTARDAMIPRGQIASLEERATFDEAVRAFQTSGYSRLPVYRESFDNIIGIVHNKDVLNSINDPGAFDLKKIIHQPVFIPDSARLGDVMRQMQRQRLHFAVVVDEHSGVEGILTLEDVLEEIVGEIQDEHDEVLDEKVRQREENVFILDGSLAVREANRQFDLHLPESDDYTTVAGFLIARSGRLLTESDTVTYNGARFTVERVDQRRITRIRMELVPPEAEVGADASAARPASHG